MRFTYALFVVGYLTGVVLAQAPDTVFLEELTWTEVRDALADGTTTVIIPTGTRPATTSWTAALAVQTHSSRSAVLEKNLGR